MLAGLPETTYGQVLVVTNRDQELPMLGAPPRGGRHSHHAARAGEANPTSLLEPGDLLARVVAAWVAVRLPDEPQPDRAFSIWGPCARAAAERL